MPASAQDKYCVKRIIYSIIIPLSLLLIPWGIHIWAQFENPLILGYGLRPLSLKGIAGIFTMPFLHGNTNHLISNSIPFFVLGSGLFYYYKEIAWKVLLYIIILCGATVWFIGSAGSNHIGASGLVYGLSGFHLTGGIIRRNRNLMAFALLVIFLYGGFIWSIFPDFFPGRNISWEGHLAGLLSGVLIAVIYRKKGPGPDIIYDDSDDEDITDNQDLNDDDSDDQQSSSTTLSGVNHVRYHVNG